MISIIIPTLNAARGLRRALPPLLTGVHAGIVRELIIVDAGSVDETAAIADAAGAELVQSALGEGAQSIAGALRARGDWLLFLHADAALEPGWSEEIAALLGGGPARAYAFRVGNSARGPRARLTEGLANLYLAAFKKPGRAQGLLIAGDFYRVLGGYTAAPRAHREFIERIGPARIKILRTRAIV